MKKRALNIARVGLISIIGIYGLAGTGSSSTTTPARQKSLDRYNRGYGHVRAGSTPVVHGRSRERHAGELNLVTMEYDGEILRVNNGRVTLDYAAARRAKWKFRDREEEATLRQVIYTRLNADLTLERVLDIINVPPAAARYGNPSPIICFNRENVRDVQQTLADFGRAQRAEGDRAIAHESAVAIGMRGDDAALGDYYEGLHKLGVFRMVAEELRRILV